MNCGPKGYESVSCVLLNNPKQFRTMFRWRRGFRLFSFALNRFCCVARSAPPVSHGKHAADAVAWHTPSIHICPSPSLTHASALLRLKGQPVEQMALADRMHPNTTAVYFLASRRYRSSCSSMAAITERACASVRLEPTVITRDVK